MINITALIIALTLGIPTGLGIAIKRIDYLETNKKKDEILDELYGILKNKKNK